MNHKYQVIDGSRVRISDFPLCGGAKYESSENSILLFVPPQILVFAEKGDAEVLGVDALEGLGLEVDPITKQLREAEALLAL